MGVLADFERLDALLERQNEKLRERNEIISEAVQIAEAGPQQVQQVTPTADNRFRAAGDDRFFVAPERGLGGGTITTNDRVGGAITTNDLADQLAARIGRSGDNNPQIRLAAELNPILTRLQVTLGRWVTWQQQQRLGSPFSNSETRSGSR